MGEAIETVPVGITEGDKLFTHSGLMANELHHSPQTVLQPLLRMLQALDDFAESSLYSSDATLLFFLIELAIDVNTFVIAICGDQRSHLDQVLTRKAKPLLARWLDEAKDVSAQCVVRSYLALVWRSSLEVEMSKPAMIQMLGHVLFVRNWHAFGTTSADEHEQDTPSENSPEQRLLRFLQAYGVDTTRISNGSLHRYLRKDKPLFLRVGVNVVRVPKLFHNDEASAAEKKLRVAVPEQRVADLIDELRHSWDAFLRHAEADLSALLKEIVLVALPARSTYALTQWQRVGTGVYECAADELVVHVHSAELRWRNQGIFPLPDALMHYKDFSDVFKNKQMHCGTVALQQHRSWLHIVGTQFDVIEWDKPDNAALGLAFPEALKDPEPPSVAAMNGGVWQCSACTFINASGTECEMCGSAMSFAQDANQKKEEKSAAVQFEGERFDRPFDPFDEELQQKLEENEKWLAAILVPVLKSAYKERMPYTLLLPSTATGSSSKHGSVRLIGCVETKGEAEGEGFHTWKEFRVNQRHHLVQVYNLVSSGRQLFKQLCFSSHQSLSLHGRLPLSKTNKNAAGAVENVSAPEPSLQILRGQHTFVPGRLLQGTLPDALIDNYQFWLGPDGVVRGDPLDAESTFFAHIILINPDKRVVRLQPVSTTATATTPPRTIQAFKRRKKAPEQSLKRPQRVEVNASSRMANEEVVQIDENAVLQLCALGFSPEAAATALRRCGNSASMAADWLLNPENAALVDAAPRVIDEKYRVIAHKDVPLYPTPSTEASGFSFGFDRRSLRFGQVVRVKEVAGNWVRISIPGSTNPAWTQVIDADGCVQLEPFTETDHTWKEASVEQDVKRRRVEEEETVDTDSNEGDDQLHEELTLVNLLEPGLEGLVAQLTRVEDLSNVLAWSDGDGLRVVELPRLKIRLSPVDGKLFVMDYAGWFLSSREVDLLCGEGIVLENGRGELQVLVGSHPVLRPAVKSNVFPLDLVHLRGSQEWLDTMDTRFFLFPVHSSGTFVHCEALSASLYLVVLHLLKRNYAIAFEMAHSCTTDTSFSTEEAFIWKQLKHTCDDRHPDAHACRLKLALCTLYMSGSSGHFPSELHDEYHAYLTKLPRVSLACRLSVNEELRIAKACSTGLPTIRNRVNVLMGNDAKLTANRLRNGGFPWVKLGRQSSQLIQDTAVGLKRVQLDAKERSVAQVITHDLVISDQESGSNRKLGFAYLYELLTGKKENLRTARLLTRSLHLKLCRWGKQEGEQHVFTSKAMAQLIVLIEMPDLDWPPLPADDASKDLLRRGVNLYDAQGRVSAVKTWIDRVDQIAMNAWDRLQSRIPAPSPIPTCKDLSAKDCSRTEPVRPELTDTSCKERELTVDWAEMPLQEIATAFTEEVASGVQPSREVPFDLSGNAASSSVVAREMLTRLEEDVARYAEMQSAAKKAVFTGGDRRHKGGNHRGESRRPCVYFRGNRAVGGRCVAAPEVRRDGHVAFDAGTACATTKVCSVNRPDASVAGLQRRCGVAGDQPYVE